MRCPFCESDKIRVVDSRPSDDGASIRRRRECEDGDCGKRFTTYERVEQVRKLVVVKRDATRVPFDSDKILKGLHAACGKRPISEEAKEDLVRMLEDQLHREFDREVSTSEIGRMFVVERVAVAQLAEHHLDVGVSDGVRS